MKPYRRVLASLLLFGLVVFQPGSSMAFGWTDIADRLARSTAYIQIVDADGEGVCTGFSINARYRYWLTAAHCNAGSLFVDEHPAIVVYQDKANDLLVLQTATYRLPAMRPGPKPRQGSVIGAYGFGWGLAATLRVGYVAGIDKMVDDPEFSGPWLETVELVPGMSGGPMVDNQGRVVSINQWGWNQTHAGYGRAIDVILKSTGNFWQYRQ